MTEQNKEISEQSQLYYFYSVGCAYCKKIEPLLDELIGEGNDILKLDLSETDNKNLHKELSDEYNIKCGTPLLINAETGNQICGYRDKDIIQKWIDGEEIPAPPKPPTRPAPPIPLMNATNEQIKKWKESFTTWSEENSHIPNLLSADNLLAKPRLKTAAPKLPDVSKTDDQLSEWKEEYDNWKNENLHIKGIQSADQLINRIKMSKQAPVQSPGAQVTQLSAKIDVLEQKLNRVMTHFGVK